jgi:hypothetical protein
LIGADKVCNLFWNGWNEQYERNKRVQILGIMHPIEILMR